MNTDYTQKQYITKKYVTKELEDYLKSNLLSVSIDTGSHLVNIGISILETKFPEIGPGYSGGSFVQSVVNNDLVGAIGKADNINIKFMKFYCILLYNFVPNQLNYKTLTNNER